MYNAFTMKKITYLSMALVLSLLFAGTALADEAESSSGTLEAIEILTGFSGAKIKEKGDLHVYPDMVAFDLNLKGLTQKFNFNPRSLLQFQIEPYLGYVAEPDSNAEIGTNFFLKAGILPQTSKFQPYIKAGIGMAYMTLHTREQGTQFNFTETGGIGFHYFLWKNTAITVEGRFRHLSNAGIDDPNSGINSYFGLGGITYQF